MNKPYSRSVTYWPVMIVTLMILYLGACEKKQEPGILPTVSEGQPSQKVHEKIPLKITINSWIGWAPLYVAKEKDLLGDVDLTIIRVEDTGARKASMLGGHVDGYASSVDNFALDSAEGVPGKIVMCFDESYGGDGIISIKSITSPKDLKGKKIAFQKGLPSHFLLLTVLHDAGLDQKDVVQIDMDADKAGAAFAAGKLDAAVTWEPWISKAATMAAGNVLVTTKEYPGLIVDTLVFSDEVLRSKRSGVQQVVKGWFEALANWGEHKAAADKIMADSYSLPIEDFLAMCEGVRFFDLTRNKEYFGTPEKPGPIYSVFDAASDLWQEAGIIKSKSSARKRIDPSFIEALK